MNPDQVVISTETIQRNGQTIQVLSYQGGLREERRLDPSGNANGDYDIYQGDKCIENGTLKNGLRDGEVERYDMDGNLKSIELYKNGKKRRGINAMIKGMSLLDRFNNWSQNQDEQMLSKYRVQAYVWLQSIKDVINKMTGGRVFRESAIPQATTKDSIQAPRKTQTALAPAIDTPSKVNSATYDELAAKFESVASPRVDRNAHILDPNHPVPQLDPYSLSPLPPPNRDIMYKEVTRGGEYEKISHIRDNQRVAQSVTGDKFKANPQTIRFQHLQQVDYLNPETQDVLQHTFESKHTTTDRRTGKTTEVKTESATLMDGVTRSRTINTETGGTIFREQTPYSHQEWQFDKDKRLVSFIDNHFETEKTPAQYRQTDYTYDQKGRLQSSVERSSVITPEGDEITNITHRDSQGNKLSGPTDVNSSPLKQGLKAAGGFALHAAAGMAGSYIGEVLRNNTETTLNGAPLLHQHDNELTLAKKKAFTNLGAAGMATAATGIALAMGEKSVAKIVGKKATVIGAKAVPVVGTVIGLGMAGTRAINGDFAGAGMEIAGAAVDYIPWAGQALSLSIDASLAARDVMTKDGLCAFAAVDEKGNPIITKDANGQDVQAIGAEINYKNDKKEGMAKWYDFDKNGKPYVALVGSFKDDAKTGEWVRLNEKGNAIGIVHFDNDRPVGDILEVDSNGNTLVQGNLTQGQYLEYRRDKNGLSTGVIAQEGPIKNGKSAGIWHGYDEKGYPQSMVDYDKGYYEKYHPMEPSEPVGAPPRVAEVGHVFPNGRILKTGTGRPKESEQSPAIGQINEQMSKIILEAQGQSFSQNTLPKTFETTDTVTRPMGQSLMVNSEAPHGLASRLSQVVPKAVASQTTAPAPILPATTATHKKGQEETLPVAQMANKAGITTR